MRKDIASHLRDRLRTQGLGTTGAENPTTVEDSRVGANVGNIRNAVKAIEFVVGCLIEDAEQRRAQIVEGIHPRLKKFENRIDSLRNRVGMLEEAANTPAPSPQILTHRVAPQDLIDRVDELERKEWYTHCAIGVLVTSQVATLVLLAAVAAMAYFN